MTLRRTWPVFDLVRPAKRHTLLNVLAVAEVHQVLATDALETEPDIAAKATARIVRLQADAEQLREWRATHPTDRHGPMGGLRKSNRTDNERAKMATEKGVIQGYTGVAAVDAQHQIIVEAQAHGTGSEQALLLPVVTALATLRTRETVLTADAGYHSEANLASLATLAINALIADPDMRKRDERFAGRAHHTTAPDPLQDKSDDATRARTALPLFTPRDFTYDADARTGVCPAGKSLYRKGASHVIKGYLGEHFRGTKRDCVPWAMRPQCLRTPETTVVRNVAFFRTREPAEAETHTMRIQHRLSRDAHDAHAAPPRCPRRTRAIRTTLCHSRTGICECAVQQAAGSLHAARSYESERPVVAVLFGAQHRKAHPRGLCGVKSRGRDLRAIANGPIRRGNAIGTVFSICAFQCTRFFEHRDPSGRSTLRLFLQPQRPVLLQRFK